MEWEKNKTPAPGKRAISIRLDIGVLEFFRATGPRWQSRINEILRRFVEERGK